MTPFELVKQIPELDYIGRSSVWLSNRQSTNYCDTTNHGGYRKRNKAMHNVSEYQLPRYYQPHWVSQTE